jgi:hypothetical protein
VDGEVPGVGGSGLVAAEFAGGLVHGAVEGVAVDRGGAGVEPDGRRVFEQGDCFTEELGGEDAGVVDGSAIGGGVPAVDAAAGEIDADVALVELGDPGADGDTVPGDDAPGSWTRVAAEDGDVVAVRVKVAGEELAHLASATGDDDFHIVSVCGDGGSVENDGKYCRHLGDSAMRLMTAG